MKFNFFKKKPKLIKIPLVKNGIEVGTWVECFEGDKYYKILLEKYGEIPKQIEIK